MIELIQSVPGFFAGACALLLFAAVLIALPVRAAVPDSATSRKSGRWITALTALLVPLVALLLYLPQGGALGALDQHLVVQKLDALHSAGNETAHREAYSDLRDTLRRQTRSWAPDPALLELQASIQSGAGDHDAAIATYRELLARRPDDANTMAALAETIYMRAVAARERAFPHEASALLERALAIVPSHPRALGLSGIRAFSESRWQDALEAWRRASSVYPPGSAERDVMQRGIAAATERLQQTEPPAAVLKLALSLGDTIDRERYPAETPVFVFARSSNGGGPPLAAKRLQLSQLPAEILLTDQDVMAGKGIEAGQEVTVVARLAVAGQPIAQVGDFQSEPVNVTVADGESRAEVLKIVIEVPAKG